MALNGYIENNSGGNQPGFFETGNAANLDRLNSTTEINDLDHALQLAAKYHFAGQGAAEQLYSIVKNVKRLAMDELDRGDGRKVESVRVERRLDGSVTIFFGV